MYEYISGMLVKVNPKYIVIDNQVIGYQIFVPNPYNYKEVNHIDGNKLNDRLDNLEICSRIENQNHAYDTKLNTYFEKAIKIKVNEIIYNSIGEAERATGILKQTLWKALNNPFYKPRKYQFTIERV